MKLIFLGDSQTVRLLNNFHFEGFQIVNLAVSGSSVEEGLKNLNAYLDKKDFDRNAIIIILLGTNNCKNFKFSNYKLVHGASRFDTSNFAKIVKICVKLFSKVLLFKVPPIPRTPSVSGQSNSPNLIRSYRLLLSREIDLVNKYISSFKTLQTVTIVESFLPFFQGETINLRLFEAEFRSGKKDLIHLNKQGLNILFKLIKEAISND